MKKFYILSIAIILLTFLVSCAVPEKNEPVYPQSMISPNLTDYSGTIQPVQQPELVTEHVTLIIEDQTTNFRVLTEDEKIIQRQLRIPTDQEPLPIVEWTRIVKNCPYTTAEIGELISIGDDISDVYESIGYPTYRDILGYPLNREIDLRYMSYETADGGAVSLSVELSGCIEEDYRYIVTGICVHPNVAEANADVYNMDFDTKVTMEIIPVFMAVERKGVNYLLEKDLITPYEATLYADEEAVYQAIQAHLTAQGAQPSVAE